MHKHKIIVSWPNDCFFCSQKWTGDVGNTAKKKQLSKETREQLIDFLLDSKKVETTDLNKKADKVEKCKDAVAVIREWGNCSHQEKEYYLLYLSARQGFPKI